ERVAVRGAFQQLAAVPPAAEPDPAALGVGDRGERVSHLVPAGVEGRIDVDQLELAVAEPGQQLEVVAEQDLVALHATSLTAHRKHPGIHERALRRRGY